MKFTAETKKLTESFAAVTRAVDARSTLPVLQNVLLECGKNGVMLTATNLELAIRTSLPASVTTAGKTTIPGKLALGYLSLLAGGEISVELGENESLHFTATEDETEIRCLPASDFPVLPQHERKKKIELPADELKRALALTLFAASTDDSRPILNAVKFTAKGKKLTLAATDGYRLAERILKIGAATTEDFLLPGSSLGELVALLGKSEAENVEIFPEKNEVLFAFGGTEIAIKKLEGNFPDYAKIIPEPGKIRAFVGTDDFLASLRKADLFAVDGNGGVEVKFEKAALEVRVSGSQTGRGVSRATAAVENPGEAITLNVRYLLEAVAEIGGKQVIFEMSEKTRPAAIRIPDDDDYVCIVMPMRV